MHVHTIELILFSRHFSRHFTCRDNYLKPHPKLYISGCFRSIKKLRDSEVAAFQGKFYIGIGLI